MHNTNPKRLGQEEEDTRDEDGDEKPPEGMCGDELVAWWRARATVLKPQDTLKEIAKKKAKDEGHAHHPSKPSDNGWDRSLGRRQATYATSIRLG